MFDIIIVGAGPAGLTSSIYAKRNNKKTLVLEEKSYGGQIINASLIENYPGISKVSGYEFATNLYNQVINLGADIKYEKVTKIIDKENYKEVITNKSEYKTKTVIIATGVRNRKLGLEFEEELIGKGISYCASCDGAFYKNKVVAVVGGGNTALEDALYLSDISKKVYLIHRRNTFKADELLVSKVKEKDNIEIIYESSIIKLNKDDTLKSIIIKDINENERELEVSGLFIAIGQIPDNNIFSNLVDLDEYGYIITNSLCETKTKGIYSVGDNRKKELRQLVTATSDGAVGVSTAIKYINSELKLTNL